MTWEELGVEPEIASVTKRVRRVFEWSDDEFAYSYQIAPPHNVYFTHMDYVKKDHWDWIDDASVEVLDLATHDPEFYWSVEPAKFNHWNA